MEAGGRTPADAAGALRFKRAQRLRVPGEFKRVYAGGRRLGSEYFTLTAQANGLEFARLGLSIAVRLAGGAVERNRVRRTIRESFRLHQAQLPALDVIVGAREAVRGASGALLRASLERLWRQLPRGPR
jgi:ribonuclease P protein component